MNAKDKLTHSLPFFSVVIPTYNVADYTRSTVENVLNQSYSDFELIIIDNGSKDVTPNILKEIAQEYEELFPLGIAIDEDVIAWHKIADKNLKLGKEQLRTAFYRIKEKSAIRQNAALNTGVRQDAVLFRHLNEIAPAKENSRSEKKHFKHVPIARWVNKIMSGHTPPRFSYLWERGKMTGLFTTPRICLFVFLHCALIWIFPEPC